MSKPIALIFGAGPRIGLSTARKFLSEGYRVAQTSRSAKQSDLLGSQDEHLILSTDVGDSGSITKAFETVRASWGHPNVVIYNASSVHFADKKDPYSSLSAADLVADLNVNVVGLFQAIKETVTGFKALDEATPKHFFYTGNVTNVSILPGFTTQGAGKSAGAFLIADAQAAYQEKGYRFYYVDQRNEDGSPVYAKVDGPAHAEFFWGVVNGQLESPWRATFVAGKGQQNFPSSL